MYRAQSHKLGKRGVFTRFLEWKRVNLALKHIKAPVLDFGCGSTAPLCKFFAPANYCGVDIQLRSIEKASALYPDCVFRDVEHLDFQRKFETVVSLAVLEHVKDPEYFVQYLKTFLEESGTLVLTTPLPHGEIFHEFGAALKLFSSKAVEEHEKLFNGQELCSLLNSAGFEIKFYQTFLFGCNQLVVAKLK